MDNLNQLGKNLSSNRRKSTQALNRDRKIIPQIERTRDIMDKEVPFEMSFVIEREESKVLLDLIFTPPPATGCCAECFCAVCEFYDGGITETEIRTTYNYIPNTVVIFKNNIETKYFTETDPQRGIITLWAHNNENIKVCYVYGICLEA